MRPPFGRARFDGPTLDTLIRAAGMPRPEARRAVARLTESGMVAIGGRLGDQYRLAAERVARLTPSGGHLTEHS